MSNLMGMKLSGTKKSNNYGTWKVKVQSEIQSYGYLGYIDGSMKVPQDMETDKMLKRWILDMISEPELEALVTECATVREAWLALEMSLEEEKDLGTSAVKRTNLQKDFLNVQLPLHKAILSNDPDKVQGILQVDQGAAMKFIDDQNVISPLMAAIGTGKGISVVEKLLKALPDDDSVANKSCAGYTALHMAANVNNKAAAALLVERMRSLCCIPDNTGFFPVQHAANSGHREVLEYLISVPTEDMIPNPYDGIPGLVLLKLVIVCEFFDIAMCLVNKYPYLAWLTYPEDSSALMVLIGRSVILNKKRFSFWERLISSCIPATTTLMSNEDSDIEIATSKSTQKPRVFQKSNSMVLSIFDQISYNMVWNIFERLVPCVRTIKDKSKANEQAIQLIKLLCEKVNLSSNFQETKKIFENAILRATESGVRDAVEVLMDAFPLSVYACDPSSNQTIFHMAVKNRSEDIFNIIYQMGNEKYIFSNKPDKYQNNLLHLAAELAPPHKLKEIPGAALQMQRELQWFEVVKQFIHPSAREQRNCEGKTPKALFTQKHKTLKEEGEKWMKDTANSCTITAALIATIMFATAITVPGGTQGDNGYPMFFKRPAFIVFWISDTVSLFTSATSLLLFLAILTSRYAEEDFFRVLPRRMIFGLATLFVSITFMIISFSATVYLVFGQNKQQWVLFTGLIFACFPIASFVLLQFPLMVDLISSSYGLGIFSKKSNKRFC